MSERLHYFNEAATPVAFDLEDSDIDSAEEALRRPNTEVERNKQHATQYQIWSDEVRRRRTAAVPQRRPSTSSLHDVIAPAVVTNNAFFPVAALPLDERTFRASMDRQPSNLSDRSRNPASLRMSRSSSGKKVRITVTPSSSTKSLTSDIDSDSSTMPNSPLKQNYGYVARRGDGAGNNEHFRKCASAADLRTRPPRTSVSPRGSAAVYDSKRAYSALQARPRIPSSRTNSEFVRMNMVSPAMKSVRSRSARPSRRGTRPSLFRNSISRLKKFLLKR